MMPPYMSEDQCNDPNSPVGSADDVRISCKNTSTLQTPEVTACFDATPDRPTICREGPVGSQDVNSTLMKTNLISVIV